MASISSAAGASPAPGRYFDIYTERASPRLDDGLPRSTSQLKIVSKGQRGHKGKTTTSPTRTKPVVGLSPSAVKATDDPTCRSIAPSPPVPSPQGYHPLPRSSSRRTVHAIEALPTDSASFSRSSSPLLEAGRQTTHSQPEWRAPRASRDDTRLAVLPVDLYAGPTTPVSADSLTGLGVSEGHLGPSDGLLEPKAAAVCGETARTFFRLRASSSGSGSSQRRHDRLAACKGGLPRSRSLPNGADVDVSGQETLSRSSTASTMPPHPRSSLPRSTTVSSIASASSEASFGTPTDELELSWNVSLDGPEDQVPIQSIDDIIRSHLPIVGVGSPSLGVPRGSPPVPAIPDRFRVEPVAIPTIDEIIRKNSAALHVPLARPLGRAASSPVATTAAGRSRARTTTEETTASSQARSSIDSISGEVLQSLQIAGAHQNRHLHYVRSQPFMSATTPASAARSRQQPQRKRQSSQGSDMSSVPSMNTHLASTPASPRFGSSSSSTSLPTTEEDIAQYLRSPRLTRLLTLRRAPNHHLHVSLADVGCPTGHPVVIFLGLGSVRYLVALYDELAVALGLRLICIDRWGLGKTGSVPDARRGFLEWAAVVHEVLDQLDVTRFSILAHSAGAPYALASAIRLDARVHGSVHLLAPWVSTAAEAAAGAYRWLRYVPSGVIRTAQAAEWKMQSWKLGKPPQNPMLGVGFDPRAPVSSDSAAASPVFAQFFEQPDRSNDDGSSGSDGSSDPVTLRAYPRAMTASPALSTGSSRESNVQRRSNISSPALLPVPPHRHSNGPPGKKSSKRLLGGLFGSPKPGTGVLPASSRSTSPSMRSGSPDPSVFSEQTHKSAGLDLGTALLRASHAESLQGGTADLLTILERTNKAAGYSYGDVERPVKIWHGLKDDKISLNSVIGLESSMQDCIVTIIPGADHSLMTNVPVIVQVLNSIASEWRK